MSELPSFLRKGAAMPPAPKPQTQLKPQPKRSRLQPPVDHQPPPPQPPELRAGSFALLAQAAPWRYAMLHDRPEDLLLWITRGQGRVTLDGLRHGVSMHQVVFAPAGTLISLEMPPGAQALLLQSPPLALPDRAPQLLRVRDSLSQAELTGHIDTLSRETTQQRPFVHEAQSAYQMLVAVWLRRQIAADDGAGAKPLSASKRLVKRYAAMIAQGYHTDQQMQDYAEALDVTPTHLTRVCKAGAGRTAAAMLTERKLYAARLLLAQPGPAIWEIAQSLGFHSAAYFTRFIKSQTGKSPSTLRRDAARRALSSALGTQSAESKT